MSDIKIFHFTMKVVLVLAVIANIAFADVLELTDVNFKEKVTEHGDMLILFYVPWCIICIQFKHEFEQASKELLSVNSPVTLAQVSCTSEGRHTCNTFDIDDYPVVRLLKNREVFDDYVGERTAKDVIDYVNDIFVPKSIKMNSIDEIDELNWNSMLAVCLCKKNGSLQKLFFRLSEVVQGKLNLAHVEHNDTEKVTFFRPKYLDNKFEQGVIEYIGDGSDLQSFAKRNYRGLVDHRRSDNEDGFKNPCIIVYFSVDYVRNAKLTNYWRNRILKVARMYRGGNITFAFSSKDEFLSELNQCGLDSDKETPVVLAKDEQDKKYVMIDEFSVDTFYKFVDDFLFGRIKPYVKSEPELHNDGLVKVAVASNFEDVVLNNGKDTLVEFYAPWCSYCKKTAMIYEEVAEKLKDEDVDLVKMNGIDNEIPETYTIRGFPSFYWLNRDSKDVNIEYVGARTVNDIIEYIAKYSTEELKGYDREGVPKKVHAEL